MAATSTTSQRWREEILDDYPRLRQIPTVVDNLVSIYESKPDLFKSAMKDQMRRERKRKPNTNTADDVSDHSTSSSDPEKFVITCIHKVASEKKDDE
jgi:hypothetical protein